MGFMKGHVLRGFEMYEECVNLTTADAIDRLVHHSIILELNLPGYRLEQSKMKSGKETEEQNARD